MIRKEKGFTLIELLVVIAIIALLMSILMPALRNVREQARNSMCMQRLQQWGVMYSMYASENDGGMMDWAEYAWAGGDFVEHAWIPMMYEYAKGYEVYLCPSATELWRYGLDFSSPRAAWDFQFIVGGELSSVEFYDYYRTGTPPNYIYAYGSYGKNGFISTNKEPWGDEPDSIPWTFQNVRVKGTFRIPIQGCSAFMGGFPTIYDEPDPTSFHSPFGEGGELGRWNFDRHNLSINLVFLDWSVRKVGLRQLWSLRWTRQKDPATDQIGWGNLNIVPDWNDPMVWPEWMRNAKNYDL